MTDRYCECDNCGWTGKESETDPYADFWSRIETGDEMPAGDCPECGAFCFVKRETTYLYTKDGKPVEVPKNLLIA